LEQRCTPDDIMRMLERKQEKNFSRTWPPPGDQNTPNEHLEEGT
jgi:hypothetical protein